VIYPILDEELGREARHGRTIMEPQAADHLQTSIICHGHQAQPRSIKLIVSVRAAGTFKPVLSGYFAEGSMRCLSFCRTSGSFCATSRMAEYSPTERP
jgi:hypothetical protein